ncbi:hypothetical protein [Paraburkholderia flagellata]|uniref:hypothetical protein n=1 Tax=Paraburkholderia flagellata TaxID=2883241 RepID=UPI001F4708D2|nr:hypothetical protein [Paraburkholderia flagellata]
MRSELVSIRALLIAATGGLITLVSASAFADATCKVDPQPFARGYCTLARGHHGQWARGTVTVTNDGKIHVKQALETDSGFFGVCGTVSYVLRDAAGNAVATGSTRETCIPNKGHGHARIVNFPEGVRQINPARAASVATVEVHANATRDPQGIFGFTIDPITFSHTWEE